MFNEGGARSERMSGKQLERIVMGAITDPVIVDRVDKSQVEKIGLFSQMTASNLLDPKSEFVKICLALSLIDEASIAQTIKDKAHYYLAHPEELCTRKSQDDERKKNDPQNPENFSPDVILRAKILEFFKDNPAFFTKSINIIEGAHSEQPVETPFSKALIATLTSILKYQGFENISLSFRTCLTKIGNSDQYVFIWADMLGIDCFIKYSVKMGDQIYTDRVLMDGSAKPEKTVGGYGTMKDKLIFKYDDSMALDVAKQASLGREVAGQIFDAVFQHRVPK